MRKAFSLVEVIIAFSLLTISVIASTQLISSSIQNNQENIYRVQAYYLAQEALELARAYRDTLWLNNEDFNTKLSPGSYTIELIENENENENENAIELKQTTPPSSQLYFTETGSGFTHSNSASNSKESPFTRTLKIQDLQPFNALSDKLISDPSNFKDLDFKLAENAKIVTATVAYPNEKTITLETILTNWKLP